MKFDKELYWKNRQDGKRGQGVVEKLPANAITPDNARIGFTNDGELVAKNRAFRRQTTRLALKSSQLRKKKKRK